MIKNLIFDFGKVLVDYEYFETLDQIFKTHEQAEEFYHLLIDGKRHSSGFRLYFWQILS